VAVLFGFDRTVVFPGLFLVRVSLGFVGTLGEEGRTAVEEAAGLVEEGVWLT
jgi:hypothetical protein